MAELKTVFENTKQRRRAVEATLSEPARELLARLSRPATTEEMVLASMEPMNVLLCSVNERLATVCKLFARALAEFCL